jgi:hypothetical protein
MNPPALRALIRRILLPIFIISLLISTGGSYLLLYSSPDRAPRAMLAKFGAVDGFGWKLHDTVGMEILTVPLTEQLRGTLQLVLFVAGSLLLIFIAAYVALSMAFERALVRPLSSLASAAASPRRWSACV